jgi:RsiW-degrading membrane proteinase PrsW (M82 family)
MLLITIYSVIALFISSIWIVYFREIDVFEKERWNHLIPMFLFGCLSIPLTIYLTELTVFPLIGVYSKTLLSQLLYFILGVGLVEELSKTIPFLLFAIFFRKKINEPLDYIIYMSVGALAFAAIENVKYFTQIGSHLIDGRSILSTVTHVYCSSIVAYGMIIFMRKPTLLRSWIPLAHLLLASINHGLYNTIASSPAHPALTWLAIGLYFLINISVFSDIMNNAMNASKHFSFKKVVDANRVSWLIVRLYFVVFIMQFLVLSYEVGVTSAYANLTYKTFAIGLIILITAFRLSRFTLIPNHWKQVIPQLPFQFHNADGTGGFRIKGYPYSEALMSTFYHEYCWVHPVSTKSSHIKTSHRGFIEKKVYAQHTYPIYYLRIYYHDINGSYTTYIIHTKNTGEDRVRNRYPIVSLRAFQMIDDSDAAPSQLLEWVYLTPYNE